MTDNPIQDAAIEANRKKDQQAGKKSKDIGKTVKGGNMLGLVSELANRRSGDGSSAATGLRKVRYNSILMVGSVFFFKTFSKRYSDCQK